MALLGCAAVLGVLVAAAAPAAALRHPLYCGANNVTRIPALDSKYAALQPALEQVQIMIRHGDRLPCFPYECWAGDDVVYSCTRATILEQTVDASATLDIERVYRKKYIPGREILPGNCGLGELTARGEAQQKQNGAHMRDAYVSGGVAALLPATYDANPSAFYLRSDDSPRTIESGQALFDGMYPPAGGEPSTAVPAIDWWTLDPSSETIEPNSYSCPRLNELESAATASAGFQQHLTDVTVPLVKEVEAVFGINVSLHGYGSGSIVTKLDCLMTHVCYDLPMPSGLDQDLFDRIIAEAEWQNAYDYAFENYTRLSAGFLLGDVQNSMAPIVAGKTGASAFVLYSGHDDGPIMPILSALGVFDGAWAPYASLISVELWSLAAHGAQWSPYGVRVVYDGQVMQLPACADTLCDLAEWNALVNPQIPARSECAKQGAGAPARAAMGASGYRKFGFMA